MDVEFRDQLPEHQGGRGRAPRYQDFAKELREHPGQWGKLVPLNPDASPAAKRMLAHNIRRGIYRALPNTEFKARMYQGDVWVRYIGEEKDNGG